MAVWVIRGGSRLADAEQDFLESGSVGIYFRADRDINGTSDADLRREIQQNHVSYLDAIGKSVDESRVQGVITYYLNQLLGFRDSIRLGDTIVMPRKVSGGHSVAHGIVESGYEYWGSLYFPHHHRRRVQWIAAEVPRQQIGHEWNPLINERYFGSTVK